MAALSVRSRSRAAGSRSSSTFQPCGRRSSTNGVHRTGCIEAQRQDCTLELTCGDRHARSRTSIRALFSLHALSTLQHLGDLLALVAMYAKTTAPTAGG